MLEQLEKCEHRDKLINMITRYFKDVKDPNILNLCQKNVK